VRPLRSFEQADAYTSPWSVRTRLRVGLWQVVWAVLFRPSPRPLSRWRVMLLRLFGCRASGRPYVANSVRVKMPWNLVLGDRSCLGPNVEVYNLAPIILKDRSTVAQEVYLCAGTHDFSKRSCPLVVGEIVLHEDCFVCVRALVLPGVEVGAGAIVGAAAVVTRDVPEWMVCAGNPCRPIKPRRFEGRDEVVTGAGEAKV
jgi:putative colanic acid biosynthesis acetyltransferase WcaF